MSWAIGYDHNHKRDIGYGVPAICDHPDCNEKISRGLGYVCGDEPYGGEHGCGLFFCEQHKTFEAVPIGEADFEDDGCDAKYLCERCASGQDHYPPKPDVQEWKDWKRTDESWAQWRKENPKEAVKL